MLLAALLLATPATDHPAFGNAVKLSVDFAPHVRSADDKADTCQL